MCNYSNKYKEIGYLHEKEKENITGNSKRIG